MFYDINILYKQYKNNKRSEKKISANTCTRGIEEQNPAGPYSAENSARSNFSVVISPLLDLKNNTKKEDFLHCTLAGGYR